MHLKVSISSGGRCEMEIEEELEWAHIFNEAFACDFWDEIHNDPKNNARINWSATG